MKKFLSIVLSIAMILSSMGTIAFAREEAPVARTTDQVETTAIETASVDDGAVTVVYSDGFEKSFNSLTSAMRYGYSGGVQEKIIVHEDITEEMSFLEGNIVTDNPNGVTITNTIVDEWIYCDSTNFTIGENVVYDASGNASGLFVYGDNCVINGTVITDCYYQRYAGTKLTINEPGSMTVKTETLIIRYMDGDPNAGIYINGDNDDSTVGFKAAVVYFYQGMINAKDANLEVGTYWQTNTTDNEGSANLVLDNSKLNVTVNEHKFKATGNSTVTLTNNSNVTAAGGFEFGEKADVSLDDSSTVGDKNYVATLNGKFCETLQSAIDAVSQGNNVIKLLKDYNGNITFSQKEGINIVFDGSGKAFDGTIYIKGNARSKGKETLTIQNLDFATDDAIDYFIDSNETTSEGRYAHNVTVKDCTFTATGAGLYAVAGMRYRQSYNITVKDCQFTGMHSVMWTTGGTGPITVDTIETKNCKNGVSFGTTTDVSVENSKIESVGEYGYGVRTDASGAYKLSVDGCVINAAVPVLVRKATSPSYCLSVEDSTLNAGKDYSIVVSAGDYDESTAITAPSEGITMNLDDNYTFSSYNVKSDNAYYTSLQSAIDAAEEKNVEDIVIDLLGDETLDVTSWETLAIGGDSTKTITINGNDNTLTFNLKDSDWSHVTTKNDAKLILNNMKIATSGYNSGHWKRNGVHFNCPVEMNNVVSDKLIGFKDDATLNKVTVNNTVADSYAVWIWAEGQNVVIDGLTVTSAANGRGIKIADEDASDAQITLDLSNSVFSTEKKAAVLVTTTSGAVINASNNDISNVKADPINLVWVDEKRAASADDVDVNGESAVVESDVATSIRVEFDKVANGEYNIVLAGYNGDINEFVSAQLTFTNNSVLLDGESEMKYTISGTDEFDVQLDNQDIIEENAGKQDKVQKWAFSANTKTLAKSGKSFVIGKITFDGFGTADFEVTGNDNFVKTTLVDTNNEDTYVVDGVNKLVLDNASIDEAVEAPMRDVTINIDFKNDLSGVKAAKYNDMTVTVENAKLGYKKTIRIGEDSAEELVKADMYVDNYTSDKAVIELKDEDALFANYQYTVTLEGAGYRTYKYVTTVDEGNDELVLTFWNNAKKENSTVDPFISVEKDGKEIRTTFLAGDISMDNTIDKYDLAAVVSYFGTYDLSENNNPQYAKYDLNRDGKIDAEDIAYVLYSFGY